MSQRDLAARLEWEQSSIVRLEGGIVAPTFPALHHLATRLGLDLHVTHEGIAVDIREAEAAA